MDPPIGRKVETVPIFEIDVKCRGLFKHFILIIVWIEKIYG